MTDPAPAPRASRRAGPRLVAFSALTVVLALGAIEGGVRVLGLYDPEQLGGSRLRYQMVFPPLFRAAGPDRYRPRDPRLVDRAFPRPTAGEAPLRVFVFGESAVAGLGLSENASFARALERRLRARPPADASVVNCGVVALASRQVLRMVRDVGDLLRAEGEPRGGVVFVLHVGNNEFLETHAARYLEATGKVGLAMRVDRALEGLHLYGWLKQRSIASRMGELSPRSFATQDLRLPESNLVEVADVPAAEADAIVARYLERVRAMVEAARAAGATPVLMTVATNLEWGGKEDPEGDWLRHVAHGPLEDDPAARRARLEAAVAEQTRRHDEETHPLRRWEALFGRAVARRALGDLAGAAADFTLAKDTDPRARRCLSRMNDGLRAMAQDLGVALVDAEAGLAADSPGGIVGFADLYDYVHFTPRGAERLAELIDERLVALHLAPALDDPAFARRRLAALAAAPRDALDVREWLGWDDAPGFLADRDLWKYEKARRRLDERAEAGTASAEELVWAGNGYALEVGGEARARDLYARAKAKDPALGAAVDADVAWLDERGP